MSKENIRRILPKILILSAFFVAFLATGYLFHRTAYLLAFPTGLLVVAMIIGYLRNWNFDKADKAEGYVVFVGVIFVFGALFSLSSWGSYSLEGRVRSGMTSCYADTTDLEKCLGEAQTIFGVQPGFIVGVTDWSAIYPFCKRVHGVKACVRDFLDVEADIDGIVTESDILSMCPDNGAVTECLIAKRREGFPYNKVVLADRSGTDDTRTGVAK